MMRQDRLQDRIAWGANIAARAAGAWADAYRPSGPNEPVAPGKRYLRLPALFTGSGGKFERPLGFGETLAYGIFDSEYTRPGDYIILNDDVWFILSQDPLLPVLCARASRIVSFSRPTAPASTGINAYGGVTSATTMPLASGWPVSITGASGAGEPSARLPTDIGIPFWTVLLPEVPTVTFLPTDLLTDDLGRQAVISAAEKTKLGWRLTVKQALT